MDPEDEHHGFAEEVDNIFINTSGDMDDEGISFPVNDYYMYNFVLDPASDVQSIVQSGAGPAEEYGTIGSIRGLCLLFRRGRDLYI
jgi:pectate lyase